MFMVCLCTVMFPHTNAFNVYLIFNKKVHGSIYLALQAVSVPAHSGFEAVVVIVVVKA